MVPSKDTRKERNERSYLEDAMTTAERRKETKAKRKLEVNVQPGNLKVCVFSLKIISSKC